MIRSVDAFYVIQWLCGPKGTAFLWVNEEEQHNIVPCVTSHGYGMGFQHEFIWLGTDDMTGWMAAPAAIAVLKSLGVLKVQKRNRK